MSVLSLEEAINSPPALYDDDLTKSKPPNENIQFCKNGASPFSGQNFQSTKLYSERKIASETRHESVLSRWKDRASIQSFMNAINNQSVKKQQMELQQQQKNQEILNKFRLFIQGNKDQKSLQQQQQQQLQQQQQQKQLVPTISPTKSTLNTSALLSNEHKLSNVPTLAQTKPKFRKVMRGGVLVSLPVNARQPPGRRSEEQTVRQEGGPLDKGVVFGSGNILDDILARSQETKERSAVTQKKGVACNSNTVVKKQKSYALRSKESNSNEYVAVSSSDEKKIGSALGTNAVPDSADGKNINISLSLTISMPGEEQHKAEINHTTTIKKAAPLALSDNGDVEDFDSPIVNENSSVMSSNEREHFDMKLSTDRVYPADENKKQTIRTIVISDSEEQGIGVKPLGHNSKPRTAAIVSSKNSQANLVNSNASNANCKPEVIILSSPKNLHNKPLNISFKQESNKQSNMTATKNIDKPKNEINKDTNTTSSDKVIIDIDSRCETVNQDVDEKAQINPQKTDQQSNPVESKPDIKPDMSRQYNCHRINSSMESNAKEFKPDIKPDLVIDNNGIKPDTAMARTAEQENDKVINIKPTKVKQDIASCEPLIDISIDSETCEDNVSPDAKFQQGNEEIKEKLAAQSPCSPSGDLVIDMDSDSELTQRATRRVKKRKRYSSQSSESSSEEPLVSSFDWIRNLSKKMSKALEDKVEQGMVVIPSQPAPSLTSNKSFPDKDVSTGGKKGCGRQTESTKEGTSIDESQERKEFDEKFNPKTGKQNKRGLYDKYNDRSTGIEDHYSRRVTRSMCGSDQDSSLDNTRRSSHQRSHNDQKSRATTSKRSQGKNSLEQPQRNNKAKGNGALEKPGRSDIIAKRRPSSRQRSERLPLPPDRKKPTRYPARPSQARESSKGGKDHKERRKDSSECLPGRSSERRGENVVIVQEDESPTLLSMVSNECVDITVVQKELSDHRKNGKGKKKKKKKKKKQTEWFLRQLKEKKAQEGGEPPRVPAPRETLPCHYYLGGKCSKGAMCQFKHEQIKELCRYYVGHVCDKHLSGMCPRMHEEFPCMFFHRKGHCLTGDTCKYSHAPLTDETREILEKHVNELTERRQAAELPVNTTSSDQTSAITSTDEKNTTPLFSNLTAATNSTSHLPHPGALSTSHPPSPGALSTPSKPAVALAPNLTIQPLRKPTVETPKVKRLCSLASFKPQSLTSLVSGVQKNQESMESVSPPKKAFLPGMFKER